MQAAMSIYACAMTIRLLSASVMRFHGSILHARCSAIHPPCAPFVRTGLPLLVAALLDYLPSGAIDTLISDSSYSYSK